MFKSYEMREFGIYIRKLRKQLGFTQKNVENQIGVSSETLRKIESGQVIPKYETLEFLSQMYKVDVLKIFSEFRTSTDLMHIYKELDAILIANNVSELRPLLDKLESQITDKGKSKLVNPIELEQFKLILHGLNKYYLGENCNEYFMKAIHLSLNDWNINKIKAFNYSPLEVRILLLISLSLVQTSKFDESNSILLKCLEELDFENVIDSQISLTIVKVLFNLSYNFYRLGDDHQSFYYSDKGIEFCKENYIFYYLGGLFFRRGISKKLLEMQDCEEDILYSIMINKMMGNNELAENYRKNAMEIYNIKI
ncbi:MAG: helix-turn-helix transcriptional regulator [Clostridia bacterium]|nr:helix-turn-helix transcriptional regulator [Clostridia bacterium]